MAQPPTFCDSPTCACCTRVKPQFESACVDFAMFAARRVNRVEARARFYLRTMATFDPGLATVVAAYSMAVERSPDPEEIYNEIVVEERPDGQGRTAGGAGGAVSGSTARRQRRMQAEQPVRPVRVQPPRAARGARK